MKNKKKTKDKVITFGPIISGMLGIVLNFFLLSGKVPSSNFYSFICSDCQEPLSEELLFTMTRSCQMAWSGQFVKFSKSQRILFTFNVLGLFLFCVYNIWLVRSNPSHLHSFHLSPFPPNHSLFHFEVVHYICLLYD